MSKVLALSIALGLLAGASDSLVGAPTDPPAASPVVDVRLDVPEGSRLVGMVPRMTLDISPETNTAVVAVGATPGPSNPRPMPRMMMVDLKTGKLSPIADLVGKAGQGMAAGGQLSSDRKRLLVNWMGQRGSTFYTIELPNGKPAKVAEGRVIALWAGDKIAITTVTMDGKLSRIRLADPSTGQSRELPVCGMVVAGLPDGTLVVGGNPEASADELPLRDAMTKGRLLHVGADGKVLGDIAPIGIVGSPPVVSANGRFMAFQSKPADAPEGPRTQYGFTVLSVDGKEKTELSTPYFPIAVMDDGAAAVIQAGSDVHGQAPVRWMSQDGKVIREVVNAVSANVIGKSLIYATNTETPAIKTVALPEE